MSTTIVCPECNNNMQLGYVLDHDRILLRQSSWIKGKPEKVFLFGLTFTKEDQYYITAYRCQNCGFLKFYADTNLFNK